MCRHETRLLQEYDRTRDPDVREQLIESFLPLARALALRYRGGTEPVDDLFQVASLGLVKAIDRFDPSRGAAFQAYAVPTIVGELKRHFRDKVMPVHMPRGMKERALEVNTIAETLTAELDRPPTVDEMAQRAGTTGVSIVEALQALEASRTVSLDAPMRGDEGDSSAAGDVFGERDDRLELADDRIAVGSAMETLDDRERRCVELRFGADLTQQEIAADVGVSQVHVSRILRAALEKLRAEVASLDYEIAA